MEICFGSTKIGIFNWEKAFHFGKKVRKNYFAPSEKYACYTPVPSPQSKALSPIPLSAINELLLADE